MPKWASTAVLILAAAAAALFGWALWKSRQPGSTGGVWGTIGGLWSGASSLTQDVTEKSVQAGRTLGGGVADASSGLKDIVDTWTPDLSDLKFWKW
jgi:hypothetical protein